MTPRRIHGLAFGVGAISTAALGLLAMALMVFGSLDAFFLIGPIGGAAVAIVLALLNANRAPLAVPDPFVRDLNRFDVVNIAHIRVAGVGGLGLMLAALVVVLQFQLLTVAYALGILGGIAGGMALIHYRRTHKSVRPSQALEHL